MASCNGEDEFDNEEQSENGYDQALNRENLNEIRNEERNDEPKRVSQRKRVPVKDPDDDNFWKNNSYFGNMDDEDEDDYDYVQESQENSDDVVENDIDSIDQDHFHYNIKKIQLLCKDFENHINEVDAANIHHLFTEQNIDRSKLSIFSKNKQHYPYIRSQSFFYEINTLPRVNFSYVEMKNEYTKDFRYKGQDDISKLNCNRKYIGIPLKCLDLYPSEDKNEYHEMLFKNEDENYFFDFKIMNIKFCIQQIEKAIMNFDVPDKRDKYLNNYFQVRIDKKTNFDEENRNNKEYLKEEQNLLKNVLQEKIAKKLSNSDNNRFENYKLFWATINQKLNKFKTLDKLKYGTKQDRFRKQIINTALSQPFYKFIYQKEILYKMRDQIEIQLRPINSFKENLEISAFSVGITNRFLDSQNFHPPLVAMPLADDLTLEITYKLLYGILNHSYVANQIKIEKVIDKILRPIVDISPLEKMNIKDVKLPNNYQIMSYGLSAKQGYLIKQDMNIHLVLFFQMYLQYV